MRVLPPRGSWRRARARSPLGDMLAYLARKRANAGAMAQRSPEFQEEARWTVRQIDIFSSDLRAGLHLGDARLPLVGARQKEA